MIYKSLLRHMCSIDTPAPPGCVPFEFQLEAEDPHKPIKGSLERTVELLQLEESLVDMFLVKGHKKLLIQTRSHPRPTVLLKHYAELLYEVSIEFTAKMFIHKLNRKNRSRRHRLTNYLK